MRNPGYDAISRARVSSLVVMRDEAYGGCRAYVPHHMIFAIASLVPSAMRAAALTISGMVPLDFETSPQSTKPATMEGPAGIEASGDVFGICHTCCAGTGADSALLYLIVLIHAIVKGTTWQNQGIPRTARSSLLYPKLNATFD